MGFQGPNAPAPPPCDQTGPLGTIKQYMETCYRRAQGPTQSRWAESELDTRYYIGDQTLFYAGVGNAAIYRRRSYVFNLIKPLVQMVSGRQRQHRKSIIAQPQDDTDSYAASQVSKLLMWATNRDMILETISEAFLGCLITGLDLLYVGLDYDTDPINGEIVVRRLPYNSFAMDPFWQNPDLSDCQWVWYRKVVSDDEAHRTLPKGTAYGTSNGYRDGKFQYLPELQLPPLQGQVTVDEFWYLSTRSALFLVDAATGIQMEWRGPRDNAELELQKYSQLQLMEKQVSTVRLAVAVNGDVVWDGANPFNTDHYPFVPVIGYYQPESAQWPLRMQGMVRGVRDPQWIYNRLKLTQLDIFESQPNSGWKFKESALVNPEDLLNVGQGRLVALRDSAMMTDVEQIPPPRIDASMVELAQSIKTVLREVTGVNEELLGAAEDDKAGILSMLRQGAGLVTLQNLFDNLDRAQKVLGENMVNLMLRNWNIDKIERITNEQADPKLKSGVLLKYDIVVEEGINTATQKQMQFAQLVQLQELGVPVPPEELVVASTLQNKQDLLQAIKVRQQQEQQVQQQQAQAAQAEGEARAMQQQARAMADQALAQERQLKAMLIPAEAHEKEALARERTERVRLLGYEADEKAQYSQRANAQALLDFVKAIKELQQIDVTQLQGLVGIAQSISQMETASESSRVAAVDAKVGARADGQAANTGSVPL
jgi:hypothetical protein